MCKDQQQGRSNAVTRILPIASAPSGGPIDAVITWVNGDAPGHRRQRAAYAAKTTTPLHENAINPHRWSDNDEIRFCLQSIENHAPWVRKLWIVTNGESPDLSGLSASQAAKIALVSHVEIFAEFAPSLPTFNSLAIESLLWRIDGLSERFLYFNDDVFLTAPLSPDDVFHGQRPVLRGRWRDFSQIAENAQARQDPAQFNHFMQINAAQIIGFPVHRVFAAAHVVHPFLRSVMAQAFDQHRAQFEAALAYRFRDLSQFLPQGLHNHLCLKANRAMIQTDADYLHIHSGQGLDQDPHIFGAFVKDALQQRPKFLCVNDLPQLEHVIPEVRAWISHAIGGFPATGIPRDHPLGSRPEPGPTGSR